MHSCPVFQIFHLFFVSFPYALGIRKRFYISQRGGSILCVKFSRYSVYQKWDYLLIATHRWVNFNYKSTPVKAFHQYPETRSIPLEYLDRSASAIAECEHAPGIRIQMEFQFDDSRQTMVALP